MSLSDEEGRLEVIENIQSICVNTAFACAVGVGAVAVAYGVAHGMKLLSCGVKGVTAVSLVGSLIFGGMTVTSVYVAGAKTNDMNQMENVELRIGNEEEPLKILRSPFSILHSTSPVTDDDIAAGWRVASVSSNILATATFTMPTNATVWESAQACGRGWGAWHIPLGGWNFTYGDDGWTNGFVWVEGYFRSKFRSRANEIRLLSERLALCPAAHWSRYNLAASRAWCATNDVDGLMVTFENAAIGDDPTKIASVQMELFPRTSEVVLRYDLANVGDATYTAGLVVNDTNLFVEVGAGTREVVFQRVHPDDWDMDGIPNGMDDNPRIAAVNAGWNQSDAWAMLAFPSNAAEIATMGYAAWATVRAAETNRHLVGMAMASPNGVWPIRLSVGGKQVMCNGKAELKFALDDGAKYRFSVVGGEVAKFSVSGTNGVETVDAPGSVFLPFETSVGGVTVHWDSPSGGWLGCLADVGITLDGRNVFDFGGYDDAGGIFGHFTPGTMHVLTGEVHHCHSNAFLDCTWSGGPGFVFASPHSLSTEVIWIAADDTPWSTNGITLVTRYLGGYALTNTVMACVGPEHVPPTGISLSCQDVLFLNDDLRPERVYAVTVGLTGTNGVTGQVTLSCDGADSTLSYFKDVFMTNRIPALAFPLGVSSNDWFSTSKTVFMSCSNIGEGELSATISFTNDTSCATSCVFNVIEPLRKQVDNERYSPGHYYNPSRLVYGDRAYLRVGVNGYFDPGDVEWRVVKGPGRVVSHAGLLATVEATADKGVVEVEARFNEDEIQPTFVLPIVKPRVIPVRAFVAPPPRTRMKEAWKTSDIQTRIDMANDIFSQVGISFDLLSTEYNFCSETNWNMQVTRKERDAEGNLNSYMTHQTTALLDHYQTNDCIEVYFLGNFIGESTRAFHGDSGIAVSRTAEVKALAHEIGHALGLMDCYPYVYYEVTNTTVQVLLPDYHGPVNRSSLVGMYDWGAESGRGFYEVEDTHGVVYEKYLMCGYDEVLAKDIPDGQVYSLKKGALSTNDTWYVEIGAEGIKTNNLEVYTK